MLKQYWKKCGVCLFYANKPSLQINEIYGSNLGGQHGSYPPEVRLPTSLSSRHLRNVKISINTVLKGRVYHSCLQSLHNHQIPGTACSLEPPGHEATLLPPHWGHFSGLVVGTVLSLTNFLSAPWFNIFPSQNYWKEWFQCLNLQYPGRLSGGPGLPWPLLPPYLLCCPFSSGVKI